MSSTLLTIDLSNDENKTVKRVNTSSANDDLRSTGKFMSRISPTFVVYYVRFTCDQLLGNNRDTDGRLEIDLDAPEPNIVIEHNLQVNEHIIIKLEISSLDGDEGYTPIISYDLQYDKTQEIVRDGTVHITSRVLESESKEVIGRSKVNLTVNKYQKSFEAKREFDRKEAREFILELVIDAGGFIKERGIPNGIVNLGVTCYMNSYIQTIFHLKAFRYYINQLATENSTDFIFCLQSLFYSLEFSDTASHTLDLVRAFGWNLEQMFMQQDVQEFSLKLLDAIEEKSKRQEVAHIVTKELFKGQLESYIKCINVQFESKKPEDFFELQLNIKETDTLTGALDQLLQQDTLFGENAYDTETMGKQDAIKGISLLKLPDVLVFNVNRSDYNLETFEPVKLLNEFRFSELLDMTNYSAEGGSYTLFAVFTHIGFDSGRGHYTVFVKPDTQWYEFNDETVTSVDWSYVSRQSYGGKYKDTMFDLKTFELRDRLKDSPSHAYMLVYVKSDKINDVINNRGQVVEYPPDVMTYTCKKLKAIQKKEQQELSYKLYLTDQFIFLNQPTGLGELYYITCHKDPQELRRFKSHPHGKHIISKDIRSIELMEMIKNQHGKNAMVYIYNHKRKHLRLIRPNHTLPQFDSNLFKQYGFVYIPRSDELDLPCAVLLIIKYFDANTGDLTIRSISLEDINTTIKGALNRILGEQANNVSVFYEPNYSRINLQYQENVDLNIAELLISRVKSEDVLTLVYTEGGEAAMEKISEYWNNLKESVHVCMWVREDMSEDHIFSITAPARVVLEYLARKSLIEDPKNYCITITANNSTSTIDYERLGELKVGNLICEDNSIVITKVEESMGDLICDVYIYDFKAKQYTIIRRNAEVEGEDDVYVKSNEVAEAVKKHEVLRTSFAAMQDFFSVRYRKYTIIRFRQYVKLKTGEFEEWTKKSILSRLIEAVHFVPVFALDHKHCGNGGEMQIKSDTNGHVNGCCSEPAIMLNLYFSSVTDAGLLLLCFNAERKIGFEDIEETLIKFVRKSGINVQSENFVAHDGEDAYADYVIRAATPEGTVVGLYMLRGQKIEAFGNNRPIDLFIMGTKKDNAPLEIDLVS